MKPRISIIILNWNGEKWLKNCVSSILSQDLDEDFEVLLVDNGSTDRSVQYVSEVFPKVKIIKLGRNYGFAKGNNLAVKHAAGEYLIFVSMDTKTEDEWLKNLVRAADKYPKYQILCSIQLPSQEQNRISTLDVFGNVTITANESSYAITDSIFASGACFMMRRKWLDNIGYLFDPNYFMYAEDVELSLRTILLGGRIGYIRDSRIQHYMQGGGLASFWCMYLSKRNLLSTYYKLFTSNGFRRFFMVCGIFNTAYTIFRFLIRPWKWRKHIKGVSGMVGGLLNFFHDLGRYEEFRGEFFKHKEREDEYIFRKLVVNGRLQRLLKRIIFVSQ